MGRGWQYKWLTFAGCLGRSVKWRRVLRVCREQLTGLKVHVHICAACAFVVYSVPHIIKARNELKCERSGARTQQASKKWVGGEEAKSVVIFAQQQGIHCLAMSPFCYFFFSLSFFCSWQGIAMRIENKANNTQIVDPFPFAITTKKQKGRPASSKMRDTFQLRVTGQGKGLRKSNTAAIWQFVKNVLIMEIDWGS